MVINEECKKCQIKRNINKYPVNATEEKITEYQYKVKEIVKNSDGLSLSLIHISEPTRP